MEQKNGYQAILRSPWGLLGLLVVIGGGLMLLALIALFFGLDIGGVIS